MPITSTKIKTWLSRSLIVTFLTALLISLWMIADALQNSTRFEHLYSILLLINSAALLALLALIILNLRALIQQVQKERAGARLTVRLVSLLVILSILPVIIVYYFSLEFLHQRLDNWFDINIEQALNDALELSRAALDSRLKEALKQTETIAEEISRLPADALELQLQDLRNLSGATELILLNPNGHIIVANSADPGRLLPIQPFKNQFLQLKHTDHQISLEPIAEQGPLYIRVTVKLIQDNQTRLLHALFPITERINQLANNVENSYIDYKELIYLQKHLKLNFTLILSLVLLLSVASVIWMAFFAARRFVAPLSKLAEGTRAVASGDYEKQLPIQHWDELGFLVNSFNEMTKRIALARDEVKQNQQLADNQRSYLEAILERLSSGVISLDHEQRLRTANLAANQILELPLGELLGKHLFQLQTEYPSLSTLYQTIAPHLVNNAQDWREEIIVFGNSGRKVLTCRGTELQLSLTSRQQRGYVIVFDDVTALIQAQRDAAWSEVARRLAHEIKNPLTPIQLSAERLRQKYLNSQSLGELDILDRMTHTIIQQVKAMKDMVNAFSDYAKIPIIHWQTLSLNQLIEEVVELYRHQEIPIHLLLDNNLPLIEIDPSRLRQVLHNLLKNALETQTETNEIFICTQYLTDNSLKCVEIHFQDRGPGIASELIDKVFEPYVTTKVKGTGLGLAIVKKIIEEHGGVVWAENKGGACISIRLPLRTKN